MKSNLILICIFFNWIGWPTSKAKQKIQLIQQICLFIMWRIMYALIEIDMNTLSMSKQQIKSNGHLHRMIKHHNDMQA